jgi:tRNA-(ms[2]io[6]A)-hydroxylase
MIKRTRHGRDEEFLDRLIMAGVVEARGHERFGCIAGALEDGPLKEFYDEITRSEERHAEIFVELAALYFSEEMVRERVDFFLAADAEICARLPFRAALH